MKEVVQVLAVGAVPAKQTLVSDSRVFGISFFKKQLKL